MHCASDCGGAAARTLDLAPLAAVLSQRVYEALVLLLRPALPLLGDGVRLACLQGARRGERRERRQGAAIGSGGRWGASKG
jgi:hypothetical protein